VQRAPRTGVDEGGLVQRLDRRAVRHRDADAVVRRPGRSSRCSQRLFEERIVPLARAAFLRARGRPRVGQRADMPLMQGKAGVVQWAGWLKTFAGLRAPERFALRFGRAQRSLDAAVQALGVALAGATSAARQLAVGRLLAVFGMDKAVTREAHFLVCPPSLKFHADT
jgi:DNA-binding transcriptional LysR family regulator